MELISPDAYKRQFADKDLKEITEEKKKIETILAEMEAKDTFGTQTSVMAQNAQDTSYLAQLEQQNGEPTTQVEVSESDKVKVTTSGENSERSIYMSYQRVLNELIKEKNPYMNEIEYKAMLRTKNADELMIIRNKLVDDINKYYKETNSMRTKSMLMALPFTKWLVKDKNVNDNIDSLEVVMKKEEYVKYIEELQADADHLFDVAQKAGQAGTENPTNPQ